MFPSEEHLWLHAEKEAGPLWRSLNRHVGTITKSKNTHKMADKWKLLWGVSLNLDTSREPVAELSTDLTPGGFLDNHLMLLDCRNHNFVQLSRISNNDRILLGYQIWFNLMAFVSLKIKRSNYNCVAVTVLSGGLFWWEGASWPGSSGRACPLSVHVRFISPSSEPH